MGESSTNFGPEDTKPTSPRYLIIGAGSRGNAYARGLISSGLGVVAAVAEPIEFKRRQFGQRYIWQGDEPEPEQEFEDWKDYAKFEQQRRDDEASGIKVVPGIDAIFVCVLDHQHVEVVTALAPLGLHMLCEKPLATSLQDCLRIQKSIDTDKQLFAIGHVLRYSPHNMMLRDLVLNQRVIGDVVSLEHTEPIGWWHFSHSYVRGHWRQESTSAPSLLTKSCHDIDFIMWMMCSPFAVLAEPHLPSTISSVGSLKQFRRQQKPKDAGNATNCMSCPLIETCQYSAKKIYYDKHLAKGKALAEKTFWPVDIVNPKVESLVMNDRAEEAKTALFESLSQDYDARSASVADIESRPWFGRCVWESDNDVVDDQVVSITWDDNEPGRGAKTAVFHMIAPTLAQCDRRGWIYGTTGEISYDSKTITVNDFLTGESSTFRPEIPKDTHHGGGDVGIVQQFASAVLRVTSAKVNVAEEQRHFMGCDLEEMVRSHVAVFAAEHARREQKVVHWQEFYEQHVGPFLRGKA